MYLFVFVALYVALYPSRYFVYIVYYLKVDISSETCHNLFIHSFHWHVQNATIPCRSQELLPILSVIYSFLPPFSTN